MFVSHQNASSNKFDGVFWDYFNTWLWIAPAVTDMEGEPDMDGDGQGINLVWRSGGGGGAVLVALDVDDPNRDGRP